MSQNLPMPMFRKTPLLEGLVLGQYQLDTDDMVKAQRFLNRHRRRHGKSQVTIGGRFTLHFTPTGIGTSARVSCNQCRKYLSLTGDLG